MKAILEFDLNEPEDRIEHLRAVLSSELCSLIWEMDNYLRGRIKYSDDSLGEEAYNELEKAREMLYDLMDKYNISMEKLIR